MIVPGFPDKAISCAPGRLGPGGAAGVMIFEVGRSMMSADPVARFFVEDVPSLEWLRDFLCDTDVVDKIHLAEALEDDEESVVEEVYSRADMANMSATIDDT